MLPLVGSTPRSWTTSEWLQRPPHQRGSTPSDGLSLLGKRRGSERDATGWERRQLLAVELLKDWHAGLGVRSYINSPALPQKLHAFATTEPGIGSRQSNQKTRCRFQLRRFSSISLNEFSRSCACPGIPLLRLKRSGDADPQASSVSHSGLLASPLLVMAARNFRTSELSSMRVGA